MTLPIQPYHEDRPWGNFIRFTLNEISTVKILTVNPGEAFSLQRHQEREETWYIISGDGTITIGEQTQAIQPQTCYVVPMGALHQITAGTTAVVILEVARGTFDENDITRITDRYGRA